MNTKSISIRKMKLITMTGLFSAMIFIFTAYIHVPTGSGYTHAGDGLIYLAACLLPTPYAVAAAIIGGALADGLSGFPIWIPATIAIKAATALFFTNKSEKIVTVRNIMGILPSLVVCLVGYSVYEGTVIAGSISEAALVAAFSQSLSYFVQTGASAALFIAVGLMLDRSGFKKMINT